MKKHLSKKTLWLSILSATALGIAIILALGCLGASGEETKKELEDGRVEKTIEYTFADGATETFTGFEDEYGRRTGTWRIETEDYYGKKTYEEVPYVDGIKSGRGWINEGDGVQKPRCYRNNKAYTCPQEVKSIAQDITAFPVLAQRYPWFLNKLNMFNFDNEYVEGYLGSLENILEKSGDDAAEFDEYYEEAVDSLTYTPYDSIILRNSTFSFFQGWEEVKNDEFRMAVLDRYRADDNTTYNIVKNTYPGYLESFIEFEIADEDFKGFCHITDSLMDRDDALFGKLDQESFFFVDSVDQRLYRAIVHIMEYEDTASVLKSIKINSFLPANYGLRDLSKELHSLLSEPNIDTTTQQVAGGVLYFMLVRLDKGDIIKTAVREAWFNKREIVTFPDVFTEFTASNSATSVTLQGEVLEDGGADVTSRGIVWADFYNPTTSDNLENHGTGLGIFETTLNNLTAGNTYYARSFATNSAGTAYGNCLKFTAGEAVGINEPELFVQDFTVYPNPAVNITSFSFNIEAPAVMALTFVNLKGQAVYHHDLGSLIPGENRIELDLSGLPNGFYSCQLSKSGRIRGEQKILIVH